MNWFYKSLGDGILADQLMEQVRLWFKAPMSVENLSADMAVFVRHDMGDLHCEWSAYFSPAASEIANLLGAQPCSKPIQAGLELLVGTEDSWNALF
ncbi:MAG TPA: hypothetical protein VN226_01580 [Anaerolineales bacterium]|nr:hypothetical protein [Anaerolineales bacterium]